MISAGPNYAVVHGKYNGREAITKSVVNSKYLLRRIKTEYILYKNTSSAHSISGLLPNMLGHKFSTKSGHIILEYQHRYLPSIDDWSNERFLHNIVKSISDVLLKFLNLDISLKDVLPNNAYQEYLNRHQIQRQQMRWSVESFDNYKIFSCKDKKVRKIFQETLNRIDNIDKNLDICHNDLYLQNISLDSHGNVNCVYDLEIIGMNHIEYDVSKVITSILIKYTQLSSDTDVDKYCEILLSNINGINRELTDLYGIINSLDQICYVLNNGPYPCWENVSTQELALNILKDHIIKTANKYRLGNE